MGLTAKVMIIITFIAMLASGVIGALIYYSYVSPVEKLADTGKLTLSQVLDKVVELDYKAVFNKTTYSYRVINNPGNKTGVIQVYGGNGTLLYKVEYSYGEDALNYAKILYSNGTIKELNKTYDEDFKTSLSITLRGQSGEMKPAAGIGPLYIVYYLTDELDIDWKTATSPRRGVISQLVDVAIIPSQVEFLGDNVRGTTIRITPKNPLFSPTVWGMPEYSISLVTYNGLVIASSYKASLSLQSGVYVVEFTLTGLKPAG